ncbi:MAG TPA: NAD-dependent dehydratase, partial [Candidatus Melainabacteria bacterium]|nr:NAD-dependent dehydratase [Candidatus Melainabacteria bacterium]
SEKAVGETINIGSGFEISIEGTARLISELMGKEIDLESEEKRLRPKDSEVVRLLAANQKAKEILQWEPSKTGLEGLKDGLEETIAWFSSSENRTYYTTEYRI